MVEEMSGGIWSVVLGGHEEGGRGSEGDNGIVGAKRESQNGRRIVACKGGDFARRVKPIPPHEIGANVAHGSCAVVVH